MTGTVPIIGIRVEADGKVCYTGREYKKMWRAGQVVWKRAEIKRKITEGI